MKGLGTGLLAILVSYDFLAEPRFSLSEKMRRTAFEVGKAGWEA